jgi:hypothetical protein
MLNLGKDYTGIHYTISLLPYIFENLYIDKVLRPGTGGRGRDQENHSSKPA